MRKDGPREKTLPGLVASLHPDLILHTGDFFGKNAHAESILARILRSWDCPQYACRGGNLDARKNYVQVMRDGGVQDLNRFDAVVTIRDARLRIFGFGIASADAMPADLQKLSDDAYNIILYHCPFAFAYTWNSKTDLMLAGHTHGGQVRLPFYGAVTTMDKAGKRWQGGRYEERGKTLIVSRGVGCDPFIPEVRFLCLPKSF